MMHCNALLLEKCPTQLFSLQISRYKYDSLLPSHNTGIRIYIVQHFFLRLIFTSEVQVP